LIGGLLGPDAEIGHLRVSAGKVSHENRDRTATGLGQGTSGCRWVISRCPSVGGAFTHSAFLLRVG
jgi:hypothetical protein